MHIKSHLSFDLIAVDAADTVTCLVEVTAPTPEAVSARPGQGLIVVLDRSGSMSGEPLETSKASIVNLTRRLAPQDAFGLVVFDNETTVIVPARRMADHDVTELERAIMSVQVGGMTNLFAGYLLGSREAERLVDNKLATTVTVLIVSDGHANEGEVDPTKLNAFAAGNYERSRITTTTVGYGIGYDEALLEAITRGGQGSHAFAPNPDEAGNAFSEVVSDLLDKSVIAAQMRIKPQTGLVDSVLIEGVLPNYADGDAIVVTLGDMYAAETRKVLFRLGVPAVPALGLATVADVVFEYTTMPDLKAHKVTFPIAVNVVPGDEAAGRIPNPIVEVEELLVAISDAKLQASVDLRSGNVAGAQRRLSDTMSSLSAKRAEFAGAGTQVPDVVTAQLDAVAQELQLLADSAVQEDVQFSSKMMMQAYSASSRNKPRRSRPPASPTAH